MSPLALVTACPQAVIDGLLLWETCGSVAPNAHVYWVMLLRKETQWLIALQACSDRNARKAAGNLVMNASLLCLKTGTDGAPGWEKSLATKCYREKNEWDGVGSRNRKLNHAVFRSLYPYNFPHTPESGLAKVCHPWLLLWLLIIIGIIS